MIKQLREATRELHEQIEQENQAKKILDHTIALEEYKLLLLQNYIAYHTTEKEISSHLVGYRGNKHEQLQKDLENLDVQSSYVAQFNEGFKCYNAAEALGAAYVVEGSALGGMVIAKELKECPALSGIEKHYFFSGNRDAIKEWKTFKKQLEEREWTEEESTQAVEKAKETFRFFGEVFREVPTR